MITLFALLLAVIVDRVAAVVDDEVITLSDVYEIGGDYVEERAQGEGPGGAHRRAAELEVLDTLIQQALVDRTIDELGMGVTRDDVEQAIDQVAAQNGLTRDQLRREVERSGMAWSVYRDQLEQSLVQMRFEQYVLMPRISVSEDEVRDLYNRRAREMSRGEVRTLEAIFLLAKDDAAKAAATTRLLELKAGLDPKGGWEAALVNTTDSLLYSQGGRLGTFKPGEAVPEIDAVAFTLPVGQVSDPIVLGGGVVLIRVASSAPMEPIPYAQVRDQLTMEVMQSHMEAELQAWTLQERRKVAVRVLLEPAAL